MPDSSTLLVRPTLVRLALAALMLLTAAPAEAVVDAYPDWMPRRRPGQPIEDDPTPPAGGWRLGPSLTSPYGLGVGLAYIWGGSPLSYKAGANWGLTNDTGTVAFQFQDGRLYGALMYYLLPGAIDGPYVETGAGIARSSGGVRFLNWPIVPHLGFGTILRTGETLVWDLNFSAAASGMLTFEGGLLFGGHAQADNPQRR